MKTILIALLSVVSLNAFADIPLTITCFSRDVNLKSKVILLGMGLAQGVISELSMSENGGTKVSYENEIKYRLDVSYSTLHNMSLIKMDYEYGKISSVSLAMPTKVDMLIDDVNPEKTFITNITVLERDLKMRNGLGTCTVRYN